MRLRISTQGPSGTFFFINAGRGLCTEGRSYCQNGSSMSNNDICDKKDYGERKYLQITYLIKR